VDRLDDGLRVRELLEGLFAGQRLAVLATQGEGQPYGSLVAFSAAPDLRRLVFATARSTRKYVNLRADPRALASRAGAG